MAHVNQIFQLSGTTAASILNPKQKKPQKTVKNHQLEYVQQLRQIQRENRIQRERERYESEKKNFKLKQFTSVAPKVDIKPPTALTTMSVSDKENKDFIKMQKEQIKLASTKISKEREMKHETVAKTTLKAPVPKHTEVAELKPREERNFLSENAKIKKKEKTGEHGKGDHSKGEQGNDADQVKHKNFGKVPEYLQKFNEEREREQMIQRMNAEKKRDCPPGMKLMPEEERLETLRCLEENRNTINSQLLRFPIVCDTEGLKRRKGQLEQRLQEIEDAIKLFSRPKVFVTE